MDEKSRTLEKASAPITGVDRNNNFLRYWRPHLQPSPTFKEERNTVVILQSSRVFGRRFCHASAGEP